MKGKIIASNGSFQYILTQTLYEHLRALKRVGLNIPSQSVINQIEDGLATRIKNGFSGSNIVVEIIQFGNFCDEIVSTAKDIHVRMPDALVVSTTPMISCDSRGECIGLSRLIDMEGNIISIGSRAGYCSVEKQIDALSKKCAGRRVIVMEDGSFTGSTLCFMLEKLSSAGADVVAVVMGIMFPDAKKKLAKSFKGELICKYHFEKPYDWMPSHDFFPFIPNSGRVVGTKVGNSHIPVHMFDHSTQSKPYIFPYGKLDKWAGLQMSQKDLIELSDFCISGAIEIFEEMGRLNGHPIIVEDVIKSVPVTSVPVPFVNNRRVDFYDLNSKVVDLLYRDHSMLVEMS